MRLGWSSVRAASTCFKHYNAHHQELAIMMFLPHWSFRSWFALGWRLGAVRLE